MMDEGALPLSTGILFSNTLFGAGKKSCYYFVPLIRVSAIDMIVGNALVHCFFIHASYTHHQFTGFTQGKISRFATCNVIGIFLRLGILHEERICLAPDEDSDAGHFRNGKIEHIIESVGHLFLFYLVLRAKMFQGFYLTRHLIITPVKMFAFAEPECRAVALTRDHSGERQLLVL